MSDRWLEGSASTSGMNTSLAECGAVVGGWYEALSGNKSIEDVLSETCKLLKVEVGLVCRRHADGRRQSYQKAIYFDCGSESPTNIPLQKSYANSVLGQHGPAVKVGSVWRMSELDDHGDFEPGLLAIQKRRGFRDFAVVILANDAGHLDLLELHSFDLIADGDSTILASVLPLILRAWRQRPAGTVSLALSKRAAILDVAKSDLPILSLENPYGLSRSEYRVCHLMKSGLLPKALADELGKSPATVRSHLRSIFAKTGTSNQTELLFRLMKAHDVVEPVRLQA